MNGLIWLEITVNRLLRLDSRHGELLQPLQDKVVQIELLPGRRILQAVFQPGAVRFLRGAGEPADLILRGPPHQLLGMLRKPPQSLAELAERGLAFEGDHQLALQLAQITSQLRPDWEEALSDLFGDSLAHRAGVAAREFSGYGRRVRHSLSQGIGDFLKYELGLAAGRDELEDLYQQIEQLRAELEQLKKDRRPASS